MILVSACLMGCHCRYDGKDNLHPKIAKLIKEGKAIPVCPEQLGGLPTPRPPAEIVGGDGKDVIQGKARVMDVNGKDVTREFIRGALQTLQIARIAGVKEAILKQRSPSCGSLEIYNGSFSKTMRRGVGVTAALLSQNGINVWDEEDPVDNN